MDLVHCIVSGSVLESGARTLNPLHQVGGQFLVLVHETLVLLVDAKHLQDAVGGGLGLGDKVLYFLKNLKFSKFESGIAKTS